MQFGPGFFPTFLYYFASTSVIFTMAAARALHVGLGSGLPQELGIAGGLLAGLIGGYFNRTVTLSMPVTHQKTFLSKLNDVLSSMGYQKIEELEDQVLVYERSALSKFFSGKVFVQLAAGTATIAGRSIQMNTIRKQMLPDIDSLAK
jgi:hypothetical protein